MTVSEYIFQFLALKGCDTVFMVSGSSAMWLVDALRGTENVKPVCCHHEQAAAMSADCYGRMKESIPGACLVTIGPGATNAITGVAEAYLDSSPMFVISGQANSKLLQYEKETNIRQHGTQSLNLEPMVTSITKYFAEVMKPEEIRYHMEKAYYEAMEGRKGPVWIDVPVDIQNRQIPAVSEMKGCFVKDGRSVLDKGTVRNVCNDLIMAKKPLILAGYGVRGAFAKEEFLELVEKWKIPVVTSRGGIDLIETDSPYFLGRPGSYGDRASHFAIQQCDFLLILGSRLSVSTIGYYPGKFAEKAKKVMVDIDCKELNKSDVPIDIKIEADLKFFLEELLKESQEETKADTSEWLHHCREMKQHYPVVLSEYEKEDPINSYFFTSLLTEQAGENSAVIVDTGSVCNIVSQSWKIKKGQRYLISGGLSCMGFWAGAMGAAACGGQIIALTGDGSMQMNIQELATIAYNRMPIKVFIYNNNGYLLIRHNQHNYMQDRFLGVGPDSGLQTPDFCKVAQAYGIKTVRIDSKSEVQEKLKEIMEDTSPVICEVIVQEFGAIEPRIASKVLPDGSLKAAKFDDLYPFLEEMEIPKQ